MLQGSTKEIEPWYKTPYSLSKISPNWMKQWAAAADVQLFLPELNPFIPSNFDLIKVHLLLLPAETFTATQADFLTGAVIKPCGN